MLLLDEHLRYTKEVSKLGFSSSNPQFIPEEYLSQKYFIIFRTCHSYGDWVIISAMPRFLKQKYPDSSVVIPSPQCISKYFSPQNWLGKHKFPFNNVIEVFCNNPYIDGMIDEIPPGMNVYHDHFRIYDLENPNIPLVEQILKFWRFDSNDITDSIPEIYWSEEEINEGDRLIKSTFENEPFGFLYIDDSFLETIDETKLDDTTEPLSSKRRKLQKTIDEFDNNIIWLYFAGKDIGETPYITKSKSIDVRSLNTTLRIQNYIKSKSKLLIGHQGGYGTDPMSRYTTCYVVPHGKKQINEHFIRTTRYIL